MNIKSLVLAALTLALLWLEFFAVETLGGGSTGEHYLEVPSAGFLMIMTDSSEARVQPCS